MKLLVDNMLIVDLTKIVFLISDDVMLMTLIQVVLRPYHNNIQRSKQK